MSHATPDIAVLTPRETELHLLNLNKQLVLTF